MVRVAVIGAGIIGLTTAVNVQKLIPHAKVTIIADKFDKATTSNGAAGIYRPSYALVMGLPLETVKGWVQDTWDYFSSLAMSSLGSETGHSLVSGYILSDSQEQIKNQLYESIVFNCKQLTTEELKKLQFPYKYGCVCTTVITQPQKFLPWLMRQFKEKGGRVEMRTVGKIEELADAYDIVVNCSGLGSRQLANDPNVYPVKGQVVHVKAPWIKTFIYCVADDPMYIIPHNDFVVVGGTHDKGDFSLDVSKEDQQSILLKSGRLIPQLKAGHVVGDWAGLRPYRDSLRLEQELLTVNGKKLRVVHNYGHGSFGITLSWGTGIQAAKLAKKWACEIPASSKL